VSQVTSAWVSFDLGVAQEMTANISGAFAEVGVRAEVSDQAYSLVVSGGADLGDAFVVIATTTATTFLGAIAAKAGSDAYAGLRGLVTRLRNARQSDQGRIEIIIRGEDRGPDIIIEADTPETALGQILTNELPKTPSGVLVYDVTEGRQVDSSLRADEHS
jgi:hypothetical protein